MTQITNVMILRNIEASGGSTTEYPFISTGRERQLDELLSDGLVVRISNGVSNGTGFGEICITEKGRALLNDDATTAPGVNLVD